MEVGGTPPVTSEQPYAKAPPPPSRGVGLRHTLWSSSAGGRRPPTLPQKKGNRKTIAQVNISQETVVTGEEKSENLEYKMPESKPNANTRLRRLPAVDLSGRVKEGGVKAHRKKNNLRVLWETQPTYDRKRITCRTPDGKYNTITPEEMIEETEAAIKQASTISP